MIADFKNLWPEQHMQWIHDHGSIPVVANWTLSSAYTIPQIAAGKADAVIDRYADFWGSKDFVIMVRLMHEFDDPNAWGHSAVGQEQAWKTAWRRIVNRFKTRGADNVGFWWCPNEGVRRDTIIKSYPGDAYVDWVGSDPYNWQYVGDSGGRRRSIRVGPNSVSCSTTRRTETETRYRASMTPGDPGSPS